MNGEGIQPMVNALIQLVLQLLIGLIVLTVDFVFDIVAAVLKYVSTIGALLAGQVAASISLEELLKDWES